jgi:hypothetical protein
MAGPYDDLAADFLPGETGWIIVDETGKPTQMVREVPPIGTPGFRVRVNSGRRFDKLVTISGASLTDQMNTRPDIRVRAHLE